MKRWIGALLLVTLLLVGGWKCREQWEKDVHSNPQLVCTPSISTMNLPFNGCEFKCSQIKAYPWVDKWAEPIFVRNPITWADIVRGCIKRGWDVDRVLRGQY